MKIDPAGTLGKIFQAFADQMQGAIGVAYPAVVVKWDDAESKADIQPLIKGSGDVPAMIQGVRVLGQRLKLKSGGSEQEYVPVYKVGDVVYAVVSDTEIKNGLAGTAAAPDTARRHDLNDSVIVGLFPASFK